MGDPANEFCRLAVERGYVSAETVQACLARAQENGANLPRLIAGEAGLNPDAARELYSEACKLAVGPDPDMTLDCSLDREENLVAGHVTTNPGANAPGVSSSSALHALASSGFGRVPTLAPVGAVPESTLVQAGSATDLAALLRPGGELGGIRLEAELGRGAMGVVWRGQHLRLQRPVAIKLLNPGLMRDPKIRSRFNLEAIGVAKLQHPNIVRIYDTSRPEEKVAYFVMEYVQGQALSDALRARRFGAEESTRLIVTVAKATHYAHTQGIVHRDLKPGNILLDTHGVPYLTDFGIAKHSDGEGLTQVGEVLGTPAYMSPEQAEGQGALVDARADVYSLGAILYRMLTGQPPFVASSSYEILNKLVSEPVLPPSKLQPVPAPIEAVVLRALAKKREGRYPSALAFAEALEQALTTATSGTLVAGAAAPAPAPAPVPMATPRAEPKAPAPRRRASRQGAALPPAPVAAAGSNPVLWILAVGVFLALGLAGALGYVAFTKSQEAQDLVDQQQAAKDAEAKQLEQADLEQLAEAWELRVDDPAKALTIAREVASRRPEAFEVHALLGLLLDPDGPDASSKLEHLEQALESQPQELELLMTRAQTLVGLDRIEEAEVAVTALSRLGEEGRVASLRIRGELALAEGAKQGAAIQFEQALKEDPSDAQLFVRLLELLIELRRYDTARKQAATFAKHHPEDARAHAWSARANQRLGRNKLARQHAKRALQLDPESELAQAVIRDLPRQAVKPPKPNQHPQGDAHNTTHAALKAGLQALQRKDKAGAQRALQTAMRERQLDCASAIIERATLAAALGRPDIADSDLSSPAMAKAERAQVLKALELHARVKAMLKQPDAATALFTRAIQLAPNHHNLIHERGHHFERVGDLERARADLEKALQLAPKDGHYWVVLGGILRKAGETEAARDAFKRVLTDAAPDTIRQGDRQRAEKELQELGGQ